MILILFLGVMALSSCSRIEHSRTGKFRANNILRDITIDIEYIDKNIENRSTNALALNGQTREGGFKQITILSADYVKVIDEHNIERYIYDTRQSRNISSKEAKIDFSKYGKGRYAVIYSKDRCEGSATFIYN